MEQDTPHPSLSLSRLLKESNNNIMNEDSLTKLLKQRVYLKSLREREFPQTQIIPEIHKQKFYPKSVHKNSPQRGAIQLIMLCLCQPDLIRQLEANNWRKPVLDLNIRVRWGDIRDPLTVVGGNLREDDAGRPPPDLRQVGRGEI
jgi:hypothetical protein